MSVVQNNKIDNSYLSDDNTENVEDVEEADEELDEYLCNYYNSLRVYDIMKTLKDMVSRIGEVPLYDNLTHSDVYELLYPTYDNQGYMF